MTNPFLIIDNNLELEVIESNHPDLSSVPLILLSSNFSPQQLEEYNQRGYFYFDDLTTKEDGILLTKTMHHLLWTWFIDEEDNDLSLIEGCSLGSAFFSSLEHLFSTILRYLTGLRKLLNKCHAVYFSSQTEGIFLDVIAFLQKEIGFTLYSVETSKFQKQQVYGKNALIMDSASRFRDLTPIFKQGGLKNKFISKVLQTFNKRNIGGKQLLVVPGGKLDSYFNYITNQESTADFNWILPPTGIQNLFSIKKHNHTTTYYYWSAIGSVNSDKIKKIEEDLKNNIRKRVTIIDPELLIKVMERHTFIYFIGAYNFYLNALSTFHEEKPILAIFSGEDYETYILAAQAAKQAKVHTAITSHGLNCWGSEKYKLSRFKVFDYGLAFGKQDADNYFYSGIAKERVFITSFPYFEQFLPVVLTKDTNNYRTALLLSPDYYNHVTLEKSYAEFKYYKEVYTLLKELEIELLGIKSRYQFHYRNLGLEDDKLEIDGKVIHLLSGYNSFPEAVKDADFVIGPASTALIEAGLMGKDYYVYQHTAFYKYVPNILPSLFDYVNGSFDMEQLRKNILKRQPYKQGCSVSDLIDLEGVKTKENLYNKFESGIQAVLNDIETIKKHPHQEAIKQ